MSDFHSIENDMSKVFEKLKELQFIGSYGRIPTASGKLGIYTVDPVIFKQDNVLLADTAKVRQELLAKAHKHYEEATKKVDAFDFNTLFTQDMLVEKFEITIMLGEKTYPAKIQIQRPLIWDKVWSTNVAGCPIQKMSFVKKGKDFEGTLTLANGSTIKTLDVTRFNFKTPYIKTIDEYRYQFRLLDPNRLQLIQHSPDGRTLHQVADKNFIFTPQN